MRLIFVSILMMIGATVSATENNIFNYVITETGRHSSIDPLDADQTQNLPVARMLYATPVELDANDKLKSSVLSSFSYDINSRIMSWKIKSGLKFSDQSPLTTRDLELALTRMIKARPSFPVIDSIEGVSDWLKLEHPLESRPTGIVTTADEVRVHFTSDVSHPLVRFSLELFSIAPEKCINKMTGELSCKVLPSSGAYVIEGDDGKSVTFKRNLETDSEFKGAPLKVRFLYLTPQEFAGTIPTTDQQSVVTGSEFQYSASALAELRKIGTLSALPAARFAALEINPSLKPFDNKACRLFLAQKFRETFKSLGEGHVSSESSIFTKLLPGYMKESELAKQLVSKNAVDCQQALRATEITWGYVSSEKQTLFVAALRETLQSLKIPNKSVEFGTRKEIADAFSEGKIAFLSVSSGFWAFDPSGDLQMLFTPNLHKQLRFLSADAELQSLIAEAKRLKTAESFKAVNEYLYGTGLFNVYAHTRRFFWSSNSKFLKSIQFGNTAPSPWQVFE